jgi:hypothetical protein
MKAKQWNLAMFSAIVALVIIAVPFLAMASDAGFGGSSDGGFGGFSDGGFGGFSDAGFEGFSDAGLSGFTGAGYGGSSGTTATATGSQSIGSASTGGFDPFDDDLGPFGDIPGNQPGDDIRIPPVTPPVIPPVSCEQTGTCPVPTPTPSPSPSPESDESLKIFIHNIFMHNPYEELPGDQVALRITFQNTGTHDLENTKVIIMIPDISVRATIGPMDVEAGEKVTSTVLLDLPEEIDEGTYSVRLQVYNEDAQRIVHREIEVIDYQ